MNTAALCYPLYDGHQLLFSATCCCIVCSRCSVLCHCSELNAKHIVTICALRPLLCSLCCVLSSLLCVNAVITAVHCVFTVRSTLPVVHCVCVRFPAPLMPVNRELVGRGQFLKYRHQPLLSMSPAGGCCPWLELPYNWQC